MKRFLLLFIIVIVSAIIVRSEDFLITRNGAEYKGKLELISDKDVRFIVKNGALFNAQSSQNTFPTADIYMIKTDKRGTIFFNQKRERVVHPTQKIAKNADIIYLVDGGEVPAWQLTMNNGIISYQKDPKQKRAMSNIGAFPKEQVFMVKYNDGSKDIFTDISETVIHETINKSVSEEKIKVIMYNVQQGDTLGSIAKKFNVTTEDIIEWNDLSPKSNSQTRPAINSTLMIQVAIN